MDNDRSWMHVQGLKGRLQPSYRNGVKYFLDFAFKDTNPNSGDKKRCPCLNCRNYFDHDRATMRVHLLRERSEKNRANALAKKIKSACGAKSTARIIYELELEAQACENENEVTEINGSSSNVTTSSQAKDDPMYLKLWEKSKRHKNGKFDNEAEEKFKELKELHEKEIGEKGVDNLTLEEAYVKVLGHRSGYARGLGKGHPVSSKDGKIGRAELEQNVEKLQNENNIMRAELEASKKKQEDLEQKLRLIMEKIGLDA